jgi:hypothetical protein
LSEAHRNNPGTGCPVGALAGDIARSGKRTRALVTAQIRDDIALLANLIRGANEADKGSARSQAILTYRALVGAIGVARAVSDEQLSREILKTLAVRLKRRTHAAPVPGGCGSYPNKVRPHHYFRLANDPGVIAPSTRQEKRGQCFDKSAKHRPPRRCLLD